MRVLLEFGAGLRGGASDGRPLLMLARARARGAAWRRSTHPRPPRRARFKPVNCCSIGLCRINAAEHGRQYRAARVGRPGDRVVKLLAQRGADLAGEKQGGVHGPRYRALAPAADAAAASCAESNAALAARVVGRAENGSPRRSPISGDLYYGFRGSSE